MIEEHAIAFAQIVESGFTIWSTQKSVFGTLAIAGESNFAGAAIEWKGRHL